MYLPGFPEMAKDFDTSPTMVQLTLSSFLIGLAIGQFVIGPLSDGIGRRPLLLSGSILCAVAVVVCVVAPTIEVLIAARFFQGIGGAAGIVLARAIVADLTEGVTTARLISALMVLASTAPIIAPSIGGVAVLLGGWRTAMGVLLALTVVMVALAGALVPESLPPERRRPAGLRTVITNGRAVLTRRRYLGFMLTAVFAFASVFSYSSSSSFVLQGTLGLGPSAYAAVFGINGIGMVLVGTLAVRLAGRVRFVRLATVGLSLSLAASTTLSLLGSAPSLGVAWPLMTVGVASLGLVLGSATALATQEARDYAGTGSAYQGALQFAAGALVAPIVGLANGGPWAMGASMAACSVIALAALHWGDGGPRHAIDQAF
ncbi:multidrug effflux MFS transporter [Amycolatopsis sp. NPDC051372]|uniref:multidrug effflux MFS transporter n=1 Tax=Amycolatopsis sp. NPDC051372 TaxID=3155669 RepID=UPI0034379F6A